jgi:hypothetical protein
MYRFWSNDFPYATPVNGTSTVNHTRHVKYPAFLGHYSVIQFRVPLQIFLHFYASHRIFRNNCYGTREGVVNNVAFLFACTAEP